MRRHSVDWTFRSGEYRKCDFPCRRAPPIGVTPFAASAVRRAGATPLRIAEVHRRRPNVIGQMGLFACACARRVCSQQQLRPCWIRSEVNVDNEKCLDGMPRPCLAATKRCRPRGITRFTIARPSEGRLLQPSAQIAPYQILKVIDVLAKFGSQDTAHLVAQRAAPTNIGLEIN